MYRYTPTVIAVALAVFAAGAVAQKPAVYPARKR
jgi:hypothetical protein